MSTQTVHVLDFDNVRAMDSGPAPVSSIRVEIPESFLDTAERVAAYLKNENGAVSAKLNERLRATPATDDDSMRSCGCEEVVSRDGLVNVEMGISYATQADTRKIDQIHCCLGTVGEIRAMCQDSAFEQSGNHPKNKTKMGM